jgi:sterol desaturase/sphingolipid hydroxylase (fatty acid hydroxylase superfamily)
MSWSLTIPDVGYKRLGSSGSYRQSTMSSRVTTRLIVLSGITATCCVVVIGAGSWIHHGAVSTKVFESMWQDLRSQVLMPWFGVFILVLWVLQWRFPARKQERLVSKGLVQDLAWFLLSPVLAVSIVSAYLDVLSRGVTTVMSGLRLNLVPTLGVWRVAILAFVVADFLGWYTHWLHHRLPTLWHFHSVHHSQREMNVLSDNRTHMIEVMVAATVAFLPPWFLGLNTSLAGRLAISTVYVSAFIHTNIRTNLGPLRFVFVSPQAHRVHHSIEAQHYDTNFGTVFSWWDYLIGTRYMGDDEYPPTGITDEAFPAGEKTLNPARVVGTWAAQMLYPFRVLMGRN